MTTLSAFLRFRPLVLLFVVAPAFPFCASRRVLAQTSGSGMLPTISSVGREDKRCQKSIKELRSLINEFAFVRGHRIYVVCDGEAWEAVLHRLTLTYGVIVNSRAAVSDIRQRETWLYARALLEGAEGHGPEYIYAHELGHFKCSCTGELDAHRAALQLLDDAHKRRLQKRVAQREP